MLSYRLVPFWDLSLTLGLYRRKPAYQPPPVDSAAVPQSRNTVFYWNVGCIKCEKPSGVTWKWKKKKILTVTEIYVASPVPVPSLISYCCGLKFISALNCISIIRSETFSIPSSHHVVLPLSHSGWSGQHCLSILIALFNWGFTLSTTLDRRYSTFIWFLLIYCTYLCDFYL